MASSVPPGELVPPVTCSPPIHDTIQGQYIELIPTQAEHAAELYEAVGGAENARLFDYMPYGPFSDMEPFQDKISEFARSQDPLFWTIRLLSTGKLVGWLSLLRIDAKNRAVEIGHIMYSAQLQRTTAATEA